MKYLIGMIAIMMWVGLAVAITAASDVGMLWTGGPAGILSIVALIMGNRDRANH